MQSRVGRHEATTGDRLGTDASQGERGPAYLAGQTGTAALKRCIGVWLSVSMRVCVWPPSGETSDGA